MKVKILSICCAVLLIICAVLSVLVIKGDAFSAKENSSGTTALPAGTGSDSIQCKLSLLHLYYESNDIVSTLPFTTIQVSQGAILKVFAPGSTSTTDALAYIDRYADRTLASAYGTMDEILAKYQKILTKYNVDSTSSYASKFKNLTSIFSSLKNSSTELISRTRTLIKTSQSSDNYDSYYTNYIEQLSDLTGKIESYCSTIMDEYDALLNSISDDYDIIK